MRGRRSRARPRPAAARRPRGRRARRPRCRSPRSASTSGHLVVHGVDAGAPVAVGRPAARPARSQRLRVAVDADQPGAGAGGQSTASAWPPRPSVRVHHDRPRLAAAPGRAARRMRSRMTGTCRSRRCRVSLIRACSFLAVGRRCGTWRGGGPISPCRQVSNRSGGAAWHRGRCAGTRSGWRPGRRPGVAWAWVSWSQVVGRVRGDPGSPPRPARRRPPRCSRGRRSTRPCPRPRSGPAPITVQSRVRPA